jgi:hypothetical protein
MQRRLAEWGRLWSLCAVILMALSLTAAPAIEAVKHGPGAMVAEADLRAYHAENGHSHDMPNGHHESGDHDHVSAAVLAAPEAAFHAPPQRTLWPDGMSADDPIREGPRRPPRLMMA